MRGWYNHPYEHSLAARGYLYHGTSVDRLLPIMRLGLHPSVRDKRHFIKSGDYIYLSVDEDNAFEWGHMVRSKKHEEPVILRIREEDIRDMGGIIEEDPMYPEDVVEGRSVRTNIAIPPEIIEIRGRDGKWRKLKE